MQDILRTLEDTFWDIYYQNEILGLLIAIAIGSIPIFVFVKGLRFFDKDSK